MGTILICGFVSAIAIAAFIYYRFLDKLFKNVKRETT